MYHHISSLWLCEWVCTRGSCCTITAAIDKSTEKKSKGLQIYGLASKADQKPKWCNVSQKLQWMLKIGANTQVQRSSLVKANKRLDLIWGLEKASENACDQIYLVVGINYLEKFLGKFCKNVLKILGKLFHADKWYFQPHGQNFVTKIWGTSTSLEGKIFSCKIFPQYLQKLMKGVVNSIEYCERPV